VISELRWKRVNCSVTGGIARTRLRAQSSGPTTLQALSGYFNRSRDESDPDEPPLLHLSNPVGQGEPVIKQKRRIGCEAGGGQRRIGVAAKVTC
jgi:hypothetical protein